MLNMKDQIFTPNALIGSGSLLQTLTQATKQKRLMCRTIRRTRWRNRPGGHFRSSQPAPAPSLGPLSVMPGRLCDNIRKGHKKRNPIV